jgi:hypothetical protein
LAALALCGCGGQNLTESWQLDRLRVLAIQAEPAEPRPGDAVSLSAFVYVPMGEVWGGAFWSACLPSGAADFGCTSDPTAFFELLETFDPATATPEDYVALQQAAAEAGVIGIEPMFPPVYLAPVDALEGLDARERLEGRSALVTVTENSLVEESEEIADTEIVLKRVPISESETPNHNPVLESWRIDGEIWEGEVLTVKAGTTVRLQPELGAASLETYTYVTSEGVSEQREEEPYLSWYAEGGRFDATITLHPYLDVVWTAPKEVGFEGKIIAVVRDRRGGMAWLELAVEVI